MFITRFARLLAVAAIFFATTSAVDAAGLLLLDFGTRTGEAEGWDIIDDVAGDQECLYLGDEFTPCTVYELTDRAGSDDDITLEILERPFIGNTAPHLGEAQVYDGLGVPVAALGDYQYRDPDTAGSTAPFRFNNIDPGTYRVTVFEGRTTDGNGQFAKLWVGDADGSNEPGEFGEHEGKNTTDFAAGASTQVLEIGEGQHLWYRHLEDNSGGISGIIIRPDNDEPFPVQGRGVVGSSNVSGTRGNQVFGDGGDLVPGLGQSWYAIGNPAGKAGVDEVVASRERAVPYFQAEGTSWWTGPVQVEGLPSYPAQIFEGDPPAFVDSGAGGRVDNYTTQLVGEILIEESGTYRFLDGVDDYTYFAIDLDRSGSAGDSDGEVLIDDNDWTDALSTANGGAPIVEVDIEGVSADGEWLPMVFMAAEGGGGDAGILYWDYNPEGDGIAGHEFFPLEKGEGVFPEDAPIFAIPDTHLRSPSTPPGLVSGDVTGSVPASPTGWEIDVNPADGTSDTFGLENPDPAIYTTILDVEGTVFHINALGEVAEGTSFKIIDADAVSGAPTIATEGWNFDAATGSVVFGEAGATCNPNSMGDLDGSGDIAFADFLILSANFGQAATDHTTGDIDCSGDIAFADFLILSSNFGATVGGTSAVPEPTGLLPVALGLFGLSLCRRRR